MFSVVLLAAGVVFGQDEAVSLAMTLPERVSRHEPVMATLSLQNLSDARVSIDLGPNHMFGWRFEVIGPDGIPKSVTYDPAHDFGALGLVILDPGETFTKRFPLDNVYAFDGIGRYRITARLDPLTPSRARAQPATGIVDVGPRDEAVLESLCARLSAGVSGADPQGRVESARELALVRDVACVPAIAAVLASTKEYDGLLIPALGRIPGSDALSLLASLAHEGGPRRQMASNALAMASAKPRR